MRGVEPAAGEVPGKTGHTVAREQKRRDREQARNALYERYEAQKRSTKTSIANQSQALSARHREAMRALKKDLASIKTGRVSMLAAQHGKQLALALWAAERARAIAQLQKAQQIEKMALRKTSDMSWKAWVEREAVNGDPAAQAALRGIRYREQRKAKNKLPGFEGEDLEQGLDPAPAARGGGGQKEVEGGSIGGELKSFDLAHFEIDHLRQRVIYRDSDGVIALEDLGQRIECRQHEDDEVIRAGLLLAAQKYGGEVFITGDESFKARAADIATAMGIRVANQELKQQREQREQCFER